MKQERNNAIDVMLQKLGRSAGRVPQNSGNGAPEANEVHLDADELNAYAENALPTTTRARYTEHMADCARCRQIASQLSQAAGVIVDQVPDTAPPSGWKTFLASLLSPIVLRYAVPALGLLVVASLGLLVLRQSQPTHLAERRAVTEASKEAPAVATPYNDRASSPIDHAGKAATRVETRQQPERTEQAKLADDAQDREKEGKPAEKAPTSTDEVAAAAPASSPSANPASPKPGAVEDQKRQVNEVAQNKVREAPQIDSYQAARANDEPAARRGAKEPPRAVTGGVASVSALKKEKPDSVTTQSARSEEADKTRDRGRADKDETETTSIAGRNFRKNGSVWIDVAYNSSLSTTNVTRGSEQYRALIADEPGIRTIAERLQGEVIVVWKGRAYRIR